MFSKRFNRKSIAAACAVAMICHCAANRGWTHPTHGSGTPHASSTKKKADYYQGSVDELNPAKQPMKPQHGGQMTGTKWHYFEVVYLPDETHVYVYSPYELPMKVREMSGELTMQINGNPKLFRFPLKPVVKGFALSDDPGYLAAKVDVSRVRDGDMKATFEISNLLPKEPKARFTQTFFLTRPRMQVTVARLTADDRPLIERQHMCPVMDAELDAHGEVMKLMVGNQPLYICCESCIEEVQKKPEFFLRKAAATAQNNRQPSRPRVSVSWATRADEAAVRAQRMCPVMDEPLDEHGTPIKVSIDGRPIFVCCKDCIDKVVENPGVYFRKLTSASQPERLMPPRRQIKISYASAADEAAIRFQAKCAVMDQPLGAHGKPIKILIDGRPVFVCCKGCIHKVEQNPEYYLSRVQGRESRDRR